MLVPGMSAADPDLVGRLPRHGGRDTHRRHRRRGRGTDRPRAGGGPDAARLDHGHLSAAGRIDIMKSLLLRAAVTGLALWVVTRMVSGIYFVFPVGASQLERVGIILVVAFVFGLVNAI